MRSNLFNNISRPRSANWREKKMSAWKAFVQAS
jgi:hypothetical protein